jgi:hypothetical protein
VHTSRYVAESDGNAGYLLLALVPLLVVSSLRAPARMLLVVTAGAYLVWFWYTQYLRYALPTLALVSALGGAAVALTAYRSDAARVRGAASGLIALIGVLSLVSHLGPTLTFPGVPWPVVLGLEPGSAFLERVYPSYTALRLLDAEPGPKRAAANVGTLPQIYSATALNPMLYPRTWGTSGTLQDEPALLGYLDRERYSHLLVDRGAGGDWWVGNLGGDEAFLRRNTMLVGGDRNVYLYRLLPPEQRGRSEPWTRGPELLPNGGFEEAAGFTPSGWAATGTEPVFDETGAWSHSGRGAVRASKTGAYVAEATVTPGAQYLLSHFTRATTGSDWVSLRIDWQAASGTVVGTSQELVPASDQGYHTWSMLAASPPDAVRARVRLQVLAGDVWFDDVSLKARDGP